MANRFTFPSEFDNAAWAKNLAVITADATTAPDGTTTADQLADDGSEGFDQVYVSQQVTLQAGQNIASIWAKENAHYVLAIQTVGFDAGKNGVSYFALDFGTTQGPDPVGSHVSLSNEDAGNGWRRCSIVHESTTDLEGEIRFHVCNNEGSLDASLDGNSTIFLWCARSDPGNELLPCVDVLEAAPGGAPSTCKTVKCKQNNPRFVSSKSSRVYPRRVMLGGQWYIATNPSHEVHLVGEYRRKMRARR